MKIILKAFWAMLTVFLMVSCSNKESDYRTNDGLVWNTTYHIIYNHDKNLADSIMAAMNRVDSSLSAFNPQSTVSRINRNETFIADSMLTKLISMSKSINVATGGAFDPTVSPLVNAWGFGYKKADNPDSVNVDSLMQFVGISKVVISGDTLLKPDSRMEFNLSAIAKGYGCDEVAQMLERNGISDYLVEIGGEIVASGHNEHGGKWTIAIDRPIESNDGSGTREVQTLIELTDCAIATSGNYRNFRNSGDKHIAHTINPTTGIPIQTDVISATIIANDCATADAFATACMAAGSANAKTFISRNNLEAMLILANGTTWMSPGFDKFIVK